jgi:hypothetical protein
MTMNCKTCRGPKALLNCGICQENICKTCAEALDSDDFFYLSPVPEEYGHSSYCSHCFDDKIAPALMSYRETLERAEEIFIYTKDQTKETRFFKRKELPYEVSNCQDQQEVIMRMSFMAAQGHFNALIDVQFHSKKIIHGSHKKTMWSGTAVPTTIDPRRVGHN